MFTFVFGLALGALGTWAYQRWGAAVPAAPMTDEVSTYTPIRASGDQPDRASLPAPTPSASIVIPTAAEVAGRPDEPLPREAPEASLTAER
jgi:hypothetical protein